MDTKRVMEEGPATGLFWIPDEDDLTKGVAAIGGTEDTPYHGGVYFFQVQFPDNYPFEPPAFTYLTNDGRTRFNPNLYKNGKVCLSLLNTWQGEKWSAVQSLMSVLQCIQSSVLIKNALQNEPSYSGMRDYDAYDRMVFHANLESVILQQLTELPPYVGGVEDAARAWFLKSRDAIVARARELASAWDGTTETVAFYHMTVRYRFGALAGRLAVFAAT